MNVRRRDKSKAEVLYQIVVSDWNINASFNGYAWGIDDTPFEERYSLTLMGSIVECGSKKAKKGTPIEITLHSGDYEGGYIREEDSKLIGILRVRHRKNEEKKERYLHANISVPEKTFTHIRAYITYKPNAAVCFLGDEMNYGKAIRGVGVV
jgi:hypothetical protein